MSKSARLLVIGLMIAGLAAQFWIRPPAGHRQGDASQSIPPGDPLWFLDLVLL